MANKEQEMVGFAGDEGLTEEEQAAHAALAAQRAEESAALDMLASAFGTELASFDLAGKDVADLDSFDEVLAESAEVLDDWALVEQHELVGKPFVIVGVNLNTSDVSRDGYYMNVRCMLADNTRVCFNDASTGVYTQLKGILKKMRESDNVRPILVKGGLRASVYCYSEKEKRIIPDGKPNQATYYLSSSLTAAQKTKVQLASIGIQVA